MASPIGAVRGVYLVLLTTLCATTAAAQDPVYDVNGAQRGRAYFSTLPFESVDTVSGNVIFTFTDLALPGDAGTGLSIVRTYNSRDGAWRFSIGGAPLRLLFKPPTNDLSNIDFISATGAENNAEGPNAQIYTRDFWRFTKSTFTLEMPNGTVAVYGHLVAGVGRYLTELKDPFDNRITLQWQANVAVLDSVTQYVGAGHTRVVTFSGWTDERPSSFSYDGRTWSYQWATIGTTQVLETFSPPTGGTWTFTYLTDSQNKVKVATVKTINGGSVTYTWGVETFPNNLQRVVVQSRSQSGNVPSGTWSFDWQSTGTILEITGPSSRVRYEPTLVENRPFAGTITVKTLGGSTLSTETLAYDFVVGPSLKTFPVLRNRQIVRGGQTSHTNLFYEGTPPANYGQPHRIEDSGAFIRTTNITYRHDFTKYVRALPETISVSVNGQPDVVTSHTYENDTGFVLSTTRAGVTSSQTRDSRGNVATATNSVGQTSHFTYDRGVLATSQTPGGVTVVRNLNADGTVASETAFGVTTTYQYDAVGRLVSAAKPGLATTTQSYVVTGGSWTATTATTGSSAVTSDLDGFGRVIHTSDGAGGQTRTTYNADGLVTYSSYPYGNGVSETGVSYTYDALGRRTGVSRPDNSSVGYTYTGMTVQITESVGPGSRTTTQELRGFGDPDQRYLFRLTDASGVVWTYDYDRFMNVKSITTTGGSFQTSPNRTWTYDSRGYLASETHPESGTTTYTRDNLGRVTQKQDARGGPGTVSYTYDADGRLLTLNAPGTTDDVTMTYNAFGQLTKQVNAAVETTLGYDGLGRVASRTDVMSGRTFSQAFTYDNENQLITHTYPSGRQVNYSYGGQGRLTGVTMQAGGGGGAQTLASSFTYHPSGALLGYQFGNGLSRTVTLNSTRQRPTQWVSGPLSITYSYDHVGNVTSITDARSAFNATYQYDVLDRLTSISGYGATSYTYDSAGNRLTGRGITYAYGANRLASLSGGQSGTFTYSANGNVLTDPTGATYTHDAFNLTKTATLNGATTTYKYGGDGSRAVKIGANGVERYYIRGVALIAEYKAVAASTVLEREYVYLGSTLLASVSAPPDTPPNISVEIVTPTSGQSISVGQTINLTALVSVPPGLTVSRVEYYNDGIFVGQSTTAPYSVPFQNNAMPLGPHLLIARVIASDNRAVSSAPVQITTTE